MPIDSLHLQSVFHWTLCVQLFGADVAQLQGGSAPLDRAAALALASRMLPDCILTTSHTDGNPTAPNQRSYVCYGLHPTWTVSHAWPDACAVPLPCYRTACQ